MAEWRPASVFIKTRFVLGAVFEANAALTLHPATISILVSVFFLEVYLLFYLLLSIIR